MYEEMYQELERFKNVPQGNGRNAELKCEANDDPLEVRLAHSSLRAGSRLHGEGANSYIIR
jgi:hypothetical protein